MRDRYRAKKPFFILFIALLCVGALLTLGRWYSVFEPGFVLLNEAVHSHISNFSLSMIVCLGIGYSWLLSGVKFRFVTALGALLIGGNVVCETWMGFMNTTDMADAVYGGVGVVTAFVFLFFTNKYGLEEKPPSGKR